MRPITIVIQYMCVAIGSLFIWIAFVAPQKAAIGGLFLGSMLYLFASLLGATGH